MADLENNPNVKNYRTTYRTERLPIEKAETAVEKMNEFVKFFMDSGLSTNPAISSMLWTVEITRTEIIGNLEADKYFKARGYTRTDESHSPMEGNNG